MDDNTKNVEPEELNRDELKENIEGVLEKIRTQAMLLGAQSMCQVILNKVVDFELRAGKKTMNDYKRIVKDIRQFCETGLKHEVETPHFGEDETVQN